MTLPWLVADWPPDAREAYTERVAICHLDGRLPLDRAEALAEECVRREWRARERGPRVVPRPIPERERAAPVTRKPPSIR